MALKNYGALRAETISAYFNEPPHTQSFQHFLNRFETWLATMDIAPGRLWIGADQMSPDDAATAAVDTEAVGLGTTISLAAADDAVATVPGPVRWGTGNITEAYVWWGVTAGTEGHTWDAHLEIATVATGEVPADKNTADDTNIALVATPAGKVVRSAVTLTGVDYTEGDLIQVLLTHVEGTTGTAHSATGAVHILGLELVFDGEGPTGSTWDSP